VCVCVECEGEVRPELCKPGGWHGNGHGGEDWDRGSDGGGGGDRSLAEVRP
jgi:hypothetical protein